jgi:mRNA-degrading endonuclease RelE of RelBE toxin-antitoxin system
MEYSVYLTQTAEKQLLQLEKSMRVRIADAIDGLAQNPLTGAKKLKTPFSGYRLRVGENRILFVVEKHHVTIYSIKHRKDAYRQ